MINLGNREVRLDLSNAKVTFGGQTMVMVQPTNMPAFFVFDGHRHKLPAMLERGTLVVMLTHATTDKYKLAIIDGSTLKYHIDWNGFSFKLECGCDDDPIEFTSAYELGEFILNDINKVSVNPVSIASVNPDLNVGQAY